MNLSPLHLCLLFSSALFCVGLIGALSRGNSILVLLGVELMLNAVNLTFVTLAHRLADVGGRTTVLFVMVVAAAEVTVGLAIVVAIMRHRTSVDADDLSALRG